MGCFMYPKLCTVHFVCIICMFVYVYIQNIVGWCGVLDVLLVSTTIVVIVQLCMSNV